MKRVMCVVFGLLFLVGAAMAELPTRSDHRSIKVVPALGPVKIDGKISEGEWDRSGRIHVYGSVRTRDKYSADFCAMWDKEYLYIGIHWRDATPMVNNVDAKGAPFDGWQADALQLRFVTNGRGVGAVRNDGYGAIHFDAFYSSAVDYNSTAFSYGRSMDSTKPPVFGGPGMSFDDPASGMAQGFTRGDGEYMQEIRIPWKMLFERVPQDLLKPGFKFSLTGEFYWGAPNASKWPQFFHQDPMSRPDRTNTYKSPQNWGLAELIGENNIQTNEPTVLEFSKAAGKKANVVARKQGVLPIRVEVPASAKKFSLAIDKDGVRYRNLVANVPVDTYAVATNGDKVVVEVLWDGRQSQTWNYNWEDFVGYAEGEIQMNELNARGKPYPTPKDKANMVIAEPGQYVARVIMHDGLKVKHEGSFFNPGNPGWNTADGSGGWLGDHRVPKWVATAAPECETKRGVVFLSSEGGECGFSLIGIDRSGEKIWSWCRNTGKVFCQVMGKKHLLFGFSYAGRLWWGKADPDTGKQVDFSDGQQDKKLPDAKGARFHGMDVYGDTIAIAAGDAGLVFFDTESGEELKLFPKSGYNHRIKFTPDGKHLLGLQGTEKGPKHIIGKLVEISVDDGSSKVIELPGMPEISAFCFDREGRFYVSDPATQTVKIFDRAPVYGEPALLGTVGEPGGRQYGKYDKMRINGPIDVAIELRDDGSKRLWCVELEFGGWGTWFRRTSVWDVTDPIKVAYYREYLGNTEYQGSGGAMSDDDPTLGLYRGAMFRVDFDKFTYECIEIAPIGCGHERTFGNNYHFFSDASGKMREYLGSGTTLAARTGDYEWKKFNAPIDANGLAWGIGCKPSKKFEWYNGCSKWTATEFDADGIPVKFATEKLPGDAGTIEPNPRTDVFKTQWGYVKLQTLYGGPNPLRVTWGWVHIIGFDNEGKLRWRYPAAWWSCHGASTAPMGQPGLIIGHLKWTGVVEEGNHTYLGLRGYKGQDFIIRDDGMYVGELFTDFREADKNLPDTKDCRGLDISDTSLTEEIFSGMMARQRDGVVRLTYGNTDVRVARAEGFDTVRDVPDTIFKVTADDAAKFKAFLPNRKAKVSTYTIAKGGAFDVNAITMDNKALVLDQMGQTELPLAMLRYDDKNLYIAYSVKDSTPWHHEQAGYATLFKTGDSIGFFHDVGTKGGTRIIMAAPDGKKLAVVHRPKGPGSKPMAYTSPVRTVSFEYVAEEPAISFEVKTTGDGYVAAASIPWSVIGLEPKPGLKFGGDLEVIFGGESTAHVQKVLRWMDAVDSIHDVPTESEIWPKNFGTFVLE